MKYKKIITTAASLALIIQMVPIQVLADVVVDIYDENVRDIAVFAESDRNGSDDEASENNENTEELSDTILLQQIDDIVDNYDLPDVGVGFIELDPQQTEALVRAIDKQNSQGDFEIYVGYTASLYTFHNDYFRDQLNDSEKELYDSWVKICSDFMISTDDITENYPDYVIYDPNTISDERAKQIVTYAYYSYPEFFFLNNGTIFGSYDSKRMIAPYVNDNFLSGSFRNKTYNEITSKTSEWMDDVNKLSNDLEKEKYIADTICNNVTYTSVSYLDQSLYGSLILETAVCNGYAMEMNYFCNAANIDCITVVSDNHAWNNVCLFDDWYVVDTTWMDQKTYIWYDWFNIDTQTMLSKDSGSSHVVKSDLYASMSLPSCTKLDPVVPDVIELSVDAANFPDALFRNYVSENIDTDNSGGLSETEINSVTKIAVSGDPSADNSYGDITDLTGIGNFINLLSLDCSANQISKLDLSNNTALTSLNCSDNKLTSLDISKNTDLIYLNCSGNQLTSLDLSSNTKLDTDPDLISDFSDNSYSIGAVTDMYSLSELPEGFDPAKASEWNGADYDSSTNTLKNFADVSADNNTVTYKYDCGNGFTATFTLTALVTKTVSIQQQPEDTAVIEGLDTSLTVKAAGNDLTYQWQKYSGSSWENIENADSAVLNLNDYTYDMDGTKYRCIVSSSTASVTSAEAVVTVILAEKVTEAEAADMSSADAIRFVNAFYSRYEQSGSDCIVLTSAQIKAIEKVLEYDYAG